jgi:hypothetical protein
MFTLFPQRIPAEIDRQSDYRLTSWEDVDPVSFLMRTVFFMLTDRPKMISGSQIHSTVFSFMFVVTRVN